MEPMCNYERGARFRSRNSLVVGGVGSLCDGVASIQDSQYLEY